MKRKCILIGGKRIQFHRYVMERRLGRKLEEHELVHHIDGDEKNNDPENLMVVTCAEHHLYHVAGRRRGGVASNRFSAELQARIREMALTEKSSAAIARALGISDMAVKRYRTELGGGDADAA